MNMYQELRLFCSFKNIYTYANQWKVNYQNKIATNKIHTHYIFLILITLTQKQVNFYSHCSKQLLLKYCTCLFKNR